MTGSGVAGRLRSLLRGLRGQPEGLTAERAARLRAAQVTTVSRMTPFMMSANLFSACVLIYMCRHELAEKQLWQWFAAMLAFCALAMAQWWRQSGRPPKEKASARAVRRVVISCVVPATLWGGAAIAVFPDADAGGKLLIASITLGALCAGAFGLSTVAPAAFAYTGLIGLFALLAIWLEGTTDYVALGVLLTAFTGITWFSIGWFNRLFNSSVIHAMESHERQEIVSLLLRDFQENASDWLFEIDADGRLTTVSPRFLERLGVRENEVLGRRFDRVLDVARPGGATAGLPVAADVARDLFARRQPFAQVEIVVEWRAERLWWSITGKPILGPDRRFGGFRGVCSEITESKRAAEKLRHMAHHDTLTGLPNRSTINDRLERDLAAGAPLALLLIDLDNFKTINDTMGHLAGDALLFEAADRLRATAGTGALVARLGGDEFAVVIAGGDAAASRDTAAAIIRNLSRPLRIDAARVHVGASVGIALAPQDACTMSDLMRRADLALHAAKAGGRGRFAAFDPGLEREANDRRDLEEALRPAAARGELRLVYQPIIDIASGRVVAAEALMRWRHPVLGDVPPARFIPVAEESGLIAAMGEWTIREACREAASWPGATAVAVNVSALQMREEQFALSVAAALGASGLLPRRLEVEMTESVLIDQPAARAQFDQLKALGVSLSLDDFGTGYSSLGYLRQFAFDKIKIDQSFVREAVERADCVAIVHAIAGLARDLGITTVAEGVETVAELGIVAAAGCTHAQGYHFGRPMEAADLRAVLHAAADGPERQARRA
jgi:diguanylate cyclase (GGDEF)-like protein/PAS domain S-box-containing protein